MLEIIKGYIGCTIFFVTVYIFGINIFKRNKNNKKIYNLITFITCSIMYFLIVYLLEGTLKTIIACIIFMIMFKLMFNANYVRCLFAALLYPVIAIFPDLLIMVISTKVFNLSTEFIHNNFAGTIIGNILSSGIMVILIIILRKPLKKMINYNLSTNKKIILISLLMLTSILIFSIICLFPIFIEKFFILSKSYPPYRCFNLTALSLNNTNPSTISIITNPGNNTHHI